MKKKYKSTSEALIDKMKEQMKEFEKETEAAKQFLIDTGICTPTGRLRKPYRNKGDR